MEIFQGREGFGGVGIGTVRVIRKDAGRSGRSDRDGELKKYDSARQRVINELRAEKSLGSHGASSMLMIMEEHQLSDAVTARILGGDESAHEAIVSVGRHMEGVLAGGDDTYLNEKSRDVKRLSKMLLSYLDGYTGVDVLLPDDCIVVADNLTTSDFLKLDRSKLRALVVESSSSNSHMAIMAKALGVPTILGCDIDDGWNGKRACVDGGWRAFYLEPDEATVRDMEERIASAPADNSELLRMRGKRCITRDGREVALYANISSMDELSWVLDNDAEGVGLYRTEPSFINRAAAPSEEELYAEYMKVAVTLGSKPCVIRTIDLTPGRDAPYLPFGGSDNASLGLRGIRLCMKYRELFKVQIRAILRAAVFGDIYIMLPMITGISEVSFAKEVIRECHDELDGEGVPCRMAKLGVMVETPAAVMMSSELAAEAGFISIGTNDLTQYTLCVDRENRDTQEFCDHHHPAVLRMIETTVKNAKKNGTPIGICGELAGDEKLIPFFLDLGIDALSVIPALVPGVRRFIVEEA